MGEKGKINWGAVKEEPVNWNSIAEEVDISTGTAPDSQKKSPVTSESGLDASLQAGQADSWTPNTPANQQTMKKIFGTDVEGKPVINTEGTNEPTTANAEDKSQQAINYISSDFVNNMDNSADNSVGTTSFLHPDNKLNKITNPHGEPEYTATHIQGRLSQIEHEKNSTLDDLRKRMYEGEPLSQQDLDQTVNAYDTKSGQLKQSASTLLSLQLFNKDYSEKPHTEATAKTEIDAVREKSSQELTSINKEIGDIEQKVKDINSHGTIRKRADDPDLLPLLTRKTELENQSRQLQTATSSQINEISHNTKYNPIRLGAEQAALLGDQKAKEDLSKLQQGKSIDPARQYQYNLTGNQIIQTGTAAAQNEKAIAEGHAHSDVSGDNLFENNKQYLVNQAAQKVGNAKYRDENALLHAIVPSLGTGVSPRQIKEYAKNEGIDERTTAELVKNPSLIPQSATIWQQMGKAMANTAAPLYEQGIRGAVAIAGGNPEAVDERFQPGWENNAGIGAVLAGNMPTEQNSFHNVRGAVGQILSGAAGLAVFGAEVGLAGKAAEGLGATTEAADKLANFGVMAFNGYNDAYHQSADIIGDKPEDESKRQLYSVIRGITEGAIFSIHPPGQLAKNAFGEIEKTGDQFLKEIKDKPIAEILQDKSRLAEYVVNSAKELGTQVTLAEGNQIAGNIINTITDKKKHSLDENTIETGVNTALSMLIPSVMSGVRHAAMQTPLNKAAIFEIGSNPEQYTQHFQQQLADGKISEDQANKLTGDIQTISNVIQATPTTNSDGIPLTPDQIKDYSFSLLQQHVLDKKVEQLNKQAEASGIEPDKAQTAPLDKGISELEKQRADILKKAGEGRPVEENNLAETKENNIPLSSQESSQESSTKNVKGNENSIQNNEGRQDGSEIQRSEENGADTEIRSTADSERRRQQEENRVLNLPGNEQETAVPQEPPSVVKPKRKRLFVNEPDEQPTPQEKSIELPADERSVATEVAETPVSDNQKEAQNASPQSKEQQQESVQQGSEPEHARTEQAGGEKPTTGPEGSHSDVGSKEKEVKPSIPERIDKLKPGSDPRKQSLKENMHELPEKAASAFAIMDFVKEHQIWGKELSEDMEKNPMTHIGGFFYGDANTVPEFMREQIKGREDEAKEYGVRLSDILAKKKPDKTMVKHYEERIAFGKAEAERYKNELATHTKEKPVEVPKQEVKFKTSKGSEYTLHPDGTTTRNKAARSDIGHEGEEGIQPRSEKTYFVTKDDLHKLDMVQTSGWGDGEVPTIADLGNGKIAVGITGGERHGKFIPNTQVEYSTEPQVGLYPLEVKSGGTAHHFGNEIIEVNREGQPEETPQPNGAIATEAPKEQTAKPPKPLSPAEKITLERKAHQSLVEKGRQAEKERQAAIKSGKSKAIQEATDKVNELTKATVAKEAKIDKLINEQTNESVFSRAADYLEKAYEKNKKAHEGEAYASLIPGLSPKLADHVVDFLVARTVEGLRDLHNVDMAIRRSIRLAKERYGKEAEELSDKDIEKIKESGIVKATAIKAEPALPIDHEEYAKDILADILAGKISRADGIKEVADEVIENRDGKPVSDAVAENAKAKILNYLDWHVQNDLTSIKNETTRLRREQFGLDEEIPAAKKEFGDTWKEAQDKIEKGYDPQNLIEELSRHPRPLTDVENAVMLHQQNTKEIELLGLNDSINKAAEAGNKGDIAEYKTTKARVLDELQKIYDVNKAVGTENARGLASRRMMVDRKYSLINMIAEKRATANEGKPLSDEQQEHIEQLHDKIKTTQEAFDNYVKNAQSEIIDLQRKALAGSLKDKSKKVADKMREWAAKIEQASKNQAYSSPIPITPKMVAEAIRLVADGVEQGGKLLDAVSQAIGKLKKANPGVDEHELEREINKELLDSGILEPTKEKREAKDMSGLFSNGKLDREAVRLKVEADRAKAQYDINLKKDEQKEQSSMVRAQDWFVKWQRAFKLSNPLTMGKLMMAGLTRLTTTPLEDIVGGAYSTVLPQLAKGAIGEGGGLNINETAKAYKNGLMLGLKDAKEIMSKESQGKSQLDVLFGKAGELPPEAIDFFGQLHSATKAPIKRAIFERSLERRLRRNMANGVDVSDPMVQTSIMMDAYKDANRAIFMQDNKVAEGWQKLIRHFEQVDKKTGKAPNKYIASTLQWMVPFVKVPTNIASEIGTHVYGVPVAATKLIHSAFTKGIESLTEQEKDIILRNLKKGTLGAAALALGYFNPQNFGGYYQPGKKRDQDDADALGLKIFGQKVPSWLVEAPIYQAMQLGATVRRVKEEMVHGEENGLGEGLWAAASGLIQDIPFASQPVRIGKLFSNPKERDYYMGELAKSTVDPALISYLAKVTDPADEGNPIRKALAPENHRETPKTIAEHIKSGLPWLREQADEK